MSTKLHNYFPWVVLLGAFYISQSSALHCSLNTEVFPDYEPCRERQRGKLKCDFSNFYGICSSKNTFNDDEKCLVLRGGLHLSEYSQNIAPNSKFLLNILSVSSKYSSGAYLPGVVIGCVAATDRGEIVFSKAVMVPVKALANDENCASLTQYQLRSIAGGSFLTSRSSSVSIGTVQIQLPDLPSMKPDSRWFTIKFWVTAVEEEEYTIAMPESTDIQIKLEPGDSNPKNVLVEDRLSVEVLEENREPDFSVEVATTTQDETKSSTFVIIGSAVGGIVSAVCILLVAKQYHVGSMSKPQPKMMNSKPMDNQETSQISPPNWQESADNPFRNSTDYEEKAAPMYQTRRSNNGLRFGHWLRLQSTGSRYNWTLSRNKKKPKLKALSAMSTSYENEPEI